MEQQFRFSMSQDYLMSQIQGGSLEEMFNLVTRELDDEARERAKKKYVNDQLIVATPKRIQHICDGYRKAL